MWSRLFVQDKRPEQKLSSFFRSLPSPVWRQQEAQAVALKELEQRVDFGLPDAYNGQRRCTTRVAYASLDKPQLIGPLQNHDTPVGQLDRFEEILRRQRFTDRLVRREQSADFLAKRILEWLYRPPNGPMVRALERQFK